jgi:hypothetical protein
MTSLQVQRPNVASLLHLTLEAGADDHGIIIDERPFLSKFLPRPQPMVTVEDFSAFIELDWNQDRTPRPDVALELSEGLGFQWWKELVTAGCRRGVQGPDGASGT